MKSTGTYWRVEYRDSSKEKWKKSTRHETRANARAKQKLLREKYKYTRVVPLTVATVGCDHHPV